MNRAPVFSQSSLWQFCCDFYAEPSIERSCLALQDEDNLNVNLLLFLLWYSMVERRILTRAEIELVLPVIDVPQQWVSEYRLFRKSLWEKMLGHSQTPDPEIKQALLAVELKLEHQVVAALFHCAQHLWIKADSSSFQELHLIELEFIAHENIDTYVSLVNRQVSDQQQRRLQHLIDHLLLWTQSVKAA